MGFKSGSGDPATESSVSATWCHTAPGSASTTEVLPSPPLPSRSAFPTAASRCRVREGSGAGAGLPAAGEAQAGTNVPLRTRCSEQPRVATRLRACVAALRRESQGAGAGTKVRRSWGWAADSHPWDKFGASVGTSGFARVSREQEQPGSVVADCPFPLVRALS